MAIDSYAKFGGVDGESKADGHVDWIALLSWSYSAQNMGQTTGGGSGKGKADMRPFVFSHYYDKASPVMHKKLTAGKHFDKVEIECRKSGDGQKTFYKIEMKEAFCDSVSISNSSGGDLLHTVSLSYGYIKHTYAPQDDKGELGGEIFASYDLKTTVTA